MKKSTLPVSVPATPKQLAAADAKVAALREKTAVRDRVREAQDAAKDAMHECARWHHNSMFLARSVHRGSPDAMNIARFMLSEGEEAPVYPSGETLRVEGWWARWIFETFMHSMRKPDGSGWWNNVTMSLGSRSPETPTFSLTVQREGGKSPSDVIGELKAERDALANELRELKFRMAGLEK